MSKGAPLRIAAILLAAGRGARFDAAGNKLLADLDGRPLLRCAAAAGLTSRAFKTIVVTGHAHIEVEAALAGLPVAFAHNPDFVSGLASSLRTGLAAATDADGVVVLLGDMPGVSSQIVDILISTFEAAPGCAAVVPVRQGQRGNPVLLSRDVFPRLAALEGDEGARRLLKSLDGVVEISFDDDGILADVDTAADLERFRAGIRRN